MAEYITRNSNNSNGRYRSKIQIIGKILEIAANRGGYGTTKNRIMYGASLSYEQLEGYLELLIENDLLSYDKQTRTFKIVEKGILFLQVFNEIDEILKEDHC